MTAPAPDYTGFIESCLREASDVATRMRGVGRAAVKPDDVNQVVTDADLALGALLTGRIGDEYPGHAILEEESGGTPGEHGTSWIVDPLDGTSNYAVGSPLYGVMMAVVGPDGVLAGGMALPAFGTVYVAQSGRGATRDGRPLEPLPTTALEHSLVAYGMDRGPAELMAAEGRLVAAIGTACLGVRMSNSVFDLCMVAEGAYGAYVHRGCRIWDVAAAVCVLGECGGRCTDLDGRPLDLTRPLEKADRIFEVCFASAAAHPSLVTAIASAVPAPEED
ncbi:inositol monophosphatase [Saccharothrix sp. 6-C]|uniref:inositol monophosphatase family protein n=1 Tax=Saccharothrix sp. 6-C TaxID=2781735 RepID=UPI0019171A04|nr:inositol monophosphatase [Saccharothrix sp. 6-C]QQQ79713.1 inositol monophosphatase [Saccharothrix sp. 6-C]